MSRLAKLLFAGILGGSLAATLVVDAWAPQIAANSFSSASACISRLASRSGLFVQMASR